MKTQLPEKSKIINDYLMQFKSIATNYYGNRLKYLVLYGSFARGDFREESDIDILVVLDTVPSKFKEIDTLTNLKLDLILDCEKFISTNPVSLESFEYSLMPFYKNVKTDGIFI